MPMMNRWFIVPETISQNPKVLDKYLNTLRYITDFYNYAIEQNIPKEDARSILPNACKTSLVMSVNARAFTEQCTLRLCSRAQWEIRDLYAHMRDCIKDIHPYVYELAVPNCAKKGCTEAKPCKHPWRKIND